MQMTDILITYWAKKLDCANESFGSVYYDNDVVAAREAVQEYIEQYEHVAKHVDESKLDGRFRLAVSSLQREFQSLPQQNVKM